MAQNCIGDKIVNYFGVLTCPGCGQKISLEPKDVITENGGYQYYCRRCKYTDDLPEDFLFKQPVGKDLNVAEAIRASKGHKTKLSLPGWLGKLFAKDP